MNAASYPAYINTHPCIANPGACSLMVMQTRGCDDTYCAAHLMNLFVRFMVLFQWSVSDQPHHMAVRHRVVHDVIG